ncbi:MAG: hypothetical protein C4542_02025 [Dehalococcoidia bacterium]|nr:MAG: hypothetical protein C4542_02025 [Dehalococcoidia bacterium]
MAKKSRKRATMADAFLKLLEKNYPEGVPVAEAAMIMYRNSGLRARARIYGLARSLRDVGHSVYALGGIYHICNGDSEKLLRVGERKEIQAIGNIKSFVRVLDETIDALSANPDMVRLCLLQELRGKAKEKLVVMVKKLA